VTSVPRSSSTAASSPSILDSSDRPELAAQKAMAFHILGDEKGAALKAIRTLPASAAVLAMRWLERGIGRVRIEVDGRSYTPDAFRQEFLFGRRRR